MARSNEKQAMHLGGAPPPESSIKLAGGGLDLNFPSFRVVSAFALSLPRSREYVAFFLGRRRSRAQADFGVARCESMYVCVLEIDYT